MRPDDDTNERAPEDGEQPARHETPPPVIMLPFELQDREDARAEMDELFRKFPPSSS